MIHFHLLASLAFNLALRRLNPGGQDENGELSLKIPPFCDQIQLSKCKMGIFFLSCYQIGIADGGVRENALTRVLPHQLLSDSQRRRTHEPHRISTAGRVGLRQWESLKSDVWSFIR